ncbi:MAG: hypothetical protein AABX69_02405, partial [Nanoarchaeota archaeon]
MVLEKASGLECALEESGSSALSLLLVEEGWSNGEPLDTITELVRNREEYVIIITDGKPELQAAARFLQENPGGLVGFSRNNLELVVLEAQDVKSALSIYYKHPLDVALIVAEKRGLETSGRRIKYLLEYFDHLVWTGVVDAYTLRDMQTPSSSGQMVKRID